MKKHYILITILLSTIILIGAGCGNSDAKYESCKQTCDEEIPIYKGRDRKEPDFSGRNTCYVMCLEKYKQ